MANKADRIKFLGELFADSNEFCRTHDMSDSDVKAEYEDKFDLSYWATKIAEMADAAQLGRSPKWWNACTWASEQILGETPTISLYRWAAFQGSVYMGFAV